MVEQPSQGLPSHAPTLFERRSWFLLMPSFFKKINFHIHICIRDPKPSSTNSKNVLEYLLLENLLLPFNREVWATVVVTFQSHILGSISLAR